MPGSRHRCSGEAGVDHVEVVELVGVAVLVEHRRRRVGAEPARAGSGSQFAISRGRKLPRSSMRIRFPEGARVCAGVPPPAPVPMMITSKRSGIRSAPHAGFSHHDMMTRRTRHEVNNR
jgi:hypothetical protein